MKTVLLAATTALLLACDANQNGGSERRDSDSMSTANKLIYRNNEGTHPGAVAYTITVTPFEIKLSMGSMGSDKKVNDTYSFNQKRWNKLMESFDKLKIKGKVEFSDGGGGRSLSFYKNEKLLEQAMASSTDESNTNYTGANINLTYLIEDFDELYGSVKGD